MTNTCRAVRNRYVRFSCQRHLAVSSAGRIASSVEIDNVNHPRFMHATRSRNHTPSIRLSRMRHSSSLRKEKKCAQKFSQKRKEENNFFFSYSWVMRLRIFKRLFTFSTIQIIKVSKYLDPNDDDLATNRP